MAISPRECGRVITTSCTASNCSMRSNALFAKRHLKVQRRETPNMLLVNRISFSRICSVKVCSLARRQAPQREQRRAQAIAAEGYLKPARAGLAKAKYVDTNNARSLRSRRCGGTPQGNTERSSKKRFRSSSRSRDLNRLVTNVPSRWSIVITARISQIGFSGTRDLVSRSFRKINVFYRTP